MSPEVRVRLGAAGASSTAAVALVAVPIRAGGGHSSNRGSSGFSSGRSSGGGSSGFSSRTGSGGSSGSGGGGGFLFGGFICLIIVIVVIVVLISMAKGAGKGTRHKGAAMPAGDPDPPPPPPPLELPPEGQEAIARIKARDPGFDEDGFENFVTTCWYLVQKAWCDKIPSESRKVMADTIWVDHKRKIDEMIAAGKTNVLEDLHIGRIDLIAAQADEDAESITARIHAYGRDYTMDHNGAVVDGDRLRRLWTEDWVFSRAASAITKVGAGTKENCPNCGAPLNLSDAGVCAYCNEMVMAGRHDWVLSRIEQVYGNEFAGAQPGW